MTDCKDIITLTRDGKFSIFNMPEVDEKMKPILTRLELLVLYLRGESSWRALDDYSFFITWNVVNGKPYVGRIFAAHNLVYDSIAIKMMFQIVNNKVEFTLTQPVQTYDSKLSDENITKVERNGECTFYVDEPVIDEAKKYSLCDQHLKEIENVIYKNEGKLSPLNIRFLQPSHGVREYYRMSQQIRDMCDVLHSTLLMSKKEVPKAIWRIINKNNISTLQLTLVKTEEFELLCDCTHIDIPSKDIHASFGVHGYNEKGQSSYNHIGKYRLNDTSREPSEKELNDIYNMVIIWLEKTTLITVIHPREQRSNEIRRLVMEWSTSNVEENVGNQEHSICHLQHNYGVVRKRHLKKKLKIVNLLPNIVYYD